VEDWRIPQIERSDIEEEKSNNQIIVKTLIIQLKIEKPFQTTVLYRLH
jgi:hypothetical protein